MGKYENMMKCAQVRSLANEKQYRNAYDLIQTLNINQITAITDLNTIADVYIRLQKYAEAREVYLKLYDRIPTRRVLYQLVYLSVKCGDIEEAEDYYSEYQELDKSSDRIILRYYIDKAKGAGRQVLIRHLQELKKEDYIEEWAYELAKLYHKEGMSEECVRECSDIALWFGDGLIAEKALLLKRHYTEGADISSEKAIMEETRNLAAELKIAAAIAERNEREQAEEALQEEYEEPVPDEEDEEAVTDEGYEEAVQKEASADTASYEEEIFAEEISEVEKFIAGIVKDIKSEREPGHVAITGEVSDKNIEIGKYLARELFKQKVLPTSKIARIHGGALNEANLEENWQKLIGGCLLIEEASKLSLDSLQSLYQFIRRAGGKVIVILSDTEEKLEDLLKKNRKLRNMIEYHIQI